MESVSCSTQCVACGTEINIGFPICRVCQTHQKKSSRVVKKFITWFSGISVVLGALTVILSLYPQAKKSIYYNEDIELVSVNATMSFAPGSLSILNRGDGDVYVSTITLGVEGTDLPYRIVLPVQKAIKKDEIGSITFMSKKASSSKYIKTINVEEVERWINSKEPSLVDHLSSKCFLLKPYDKKKGSYLIDRDIEGVGVWAELEFFSLATRKVESYRSKTPIEGLLFLRSTTDCTL